MIKTFRFDSDTSEFSSNTYVVGIKNGPCVVIDLGSTQDRVKQYILENHTSCVGILLTHGHFDHIRGIKKFLETFSCTVFIDANDDDLLVDSKLNGSKYHGEEDISLNIVNKYLLDDEDEINFGGGLFFKVIETPFHTQGSVCFLYENENALFTGDTLFKNSIGRTDLPTGNERQVKGTLEIFRGLDPKLNIYPGHGDSSTIEKELMNNIYLKQRKEAI